MPTQLTNASSMLVFQIGGYVPTQFSAAFYNVRIYVSHLSGTHLNSMASLYQCICTAIVIPVLTTLLQLKFQATDPFATHPTTMLVLVSSSTINYLACVAFFRCPLRRFARLCLVCSAYVSVASLAALLLPDPLAPYVYSIFVFISAAEAFYWTKLAMEGVDFQAYRRRFLNNLCRARPNWRTSHILPL